MKKIKLIGILVLVFALGALIVQNRNPVQAHFLLVTVEMPHVPLLLLAAGLEFFRHIQAWRVKEKFRMHDKTLELKVLMLDASTGFLSHGTLPCRRFPYFDKSSYIHLRMRSRQPEKKGPSLSNPLF